MNPSPTLTAELLRTRARVGPLWVPVTGPSMGRRYPEGSHVCIAPCDRPPRFGEIWAFVDDEDRLVVHRCVLRTRDGRWRFRGDAVRSIDPPVARPQLVGPVTAVDTGDGGRPPRLRDMIDPTWGLVVSRLRRAVRGVRRRLARRVSRLESHRADPTVK